MKYSLTHQDGKSEVVEIEPLNSSSDRGGIAPGAQFVLALGFVVTMFFAWRDRVSEKIKEKGK